MRSKPNHNSIRYVRIVACFLFALLLIGTLEASARIIYAYQDELFELRKIVSGTSLSQSLDGFEVQATDQVGHWRLRPGYETTYAQYMLDKHSKAHGVPRVIADNIPSGSQGAKVFRINEQGFKGREISTEPSGVRILMLGDSVTFGLLTDDYPQFAEAYLQSKSINAEIINAGVEGYAVKNLQYELDRYLSVSPDIVTIYIGWNDIFSSREWLHEWERPFRFLWLVREFIRSVKIITSDKRETSIALRNRTLHPRQENFDWLKEYSPPALHELSGLVESFQDAGVQPVLITLPGLYQGSDQLSAQMLKIGHLPEYTTNPYLFAKVTEEFNAGIRNVAHEMGVPVIDLSAWAKVALSDKIQYFSDSVHMTPAGLRLVGEEIAENLAPIIRNIETEKKTGR